MHRLSRTVRFAVNPAEDASPAPNGYAGKPAVRGLGRHYEITVACRGEPDPVTGYLVDITDIDHAVREAAVPAVARACAERPRTEPAALLPDLARRVQDALGRPLERIDWRLTPFYSVSMETRDMTAVLLKQRFEFAASHRLHAPSLSDEQNKRVYGKCNNPAGHGHNYVVEPEVAVELRSDAPAMTLAQLEPLVDQTIIQRFDHKHLNSDCPEFADLIPSVERIAQVCYGLLAPELARTPGVGLRRVTVWETEKTCAVYPAAEPAPNPR